MKTTSYIQVQCFSNENEKTPYATLAIEGDIQDYGIEEAKEHIKRAIESETTYLQKNRVLPENMTPKTVYRIVRITKTEEVIEII